MVFLIVFILIILVGLGMLAYLWTVEKSDLEPSPSSVPVSNPAQVFEEVESLPPQEAWSVFSVGKEFNQAKEAVRMEVDGQSRPSVMSGVGFFFGKIKYAIALTFQEEEIFFFAFLQWTSIALGYLLWVQMLAWIPADVWRSTESSSEGSPADIILFLWSFVCVGLAAFPLSIFSACMGAVHFLRRQGKESSIAACLRIVLPRAWPLWVFQWIDGWITVCQILKRLPKKRGRMSSPLDEALYFAWKLATIGILPGLVTGHGLLESCRGSLDLVRKKFIQVTALRMGYSLLCWIVGISSYVGAIFFLFRFHSLILPPGSEIYGRVFQFYFWMGVPILFAVAAVQLLLRPIYIIASCDIYSDYLQEKGEPVKLLRSPSKTMSALVAFGLLAGALLVAVLFREQLGITRLLAMPYGVK